MFDPLKSIKVLIIATTAAFYCVLPSSATTISIGMLSQQEELDTVARACVKIAGVDDLSNIAYAVFNSDGTRVSELGSVEHGNTLKLYPLCKGNTYILVLYPKDEFYRNSSISRVVSANSKTAQGG